MPLISIVVPVFKVEKYLEKNIKSILNQTFNDFELLLVNDGSPDNCGDICDKYAKIDDRIKVIHKENGGLSDARNAGIDIAIGEYLGFIDSDDYIEATMYETLYNNLMKYNADISVCGYYSCYKNTRIRNSTDNEISIMNTEEAIGNINKIFSGVTNKLFKRKIFNKLRFPIGKVNEDVFILMDILTSAKKIIFSPEPKYYYIQRANSILNRKFTPSKWDAVEAWSKNLEFVQLNYPTQKEVIEYKYLSAYISLLDSLITLKNYNNIKDYQKVRQFIKNNFMKFIMNDYIIFKRKVALGAYLICPFIYKKAVIMLQEGRGLISK